MSIAIRIDEELYEDAKQSAIAEFRTPPHTLTLLLLGVYEKFYRDLKRITEKPESCRSFAK